MNPKVCWCCAGYTGTRAYHVRMWFDGKVRLLCGKCKREVAKGYLVVRVERVK